MRHHPTSRPSSIYFGQGTRIAVPGPQLRTRNPDGPTERVSKVMEIVFRFIAHLCTATHSAATAVIWASLPSFLPSARLRTTM